MFSSDFRLVNWMSHILKILLWVIQGRMYAGYHEQNSFSRRNRNKRNAVLYKCYCCKNAGNFKIRFSCFIDFEKVFDRVQCTQLIEAIHRMISTYDYWRIFIEIKWQLLKLTEIIIKPIACQSVHVGEGVGGVTYHVYVYKVNQSRWIVFTLWKNIKCSKKKFIIFPFNFMQK